MQTPEKKLIYSFVETMEIIVFVGNTFFKNWNIENHSVYKSAEWREIPKKSLIIEDMDVVNQQLLELYKPVKYKFENSIDKFNENIYNDTIAYKNITNDKILQKALMRFVYGKISKLTKLSRYIN